MDLLAPCPLPGRNTWLLGEAGRTGAQHTPQQRARWAERMKNRTKVRDREKEREERRSEKRRKRGRDMKSMRKKASIDARQTTATLTFDPFVPDITYIT